MSLKSNPQDTKIGLTMRPLGLGKVEWLVKEEKRRMQNHLRKRTRKIKKKKLRIVEKQKKRNR